MQAAVAMNIDKEKSMTKPNQTLSEKLDAGTVLVAEGYIFELERRGFLKAGPFVPEAVLKYPDVVQGLHREFVRAGTDVVVACTYYAHRAKLQSIGIENALEQLNVKAVELAVEAARETGALVAGNVCNTWEYDPSNLKASEEKVRQIFREQVQWAKAGGADFIIAETFSHYGEALLSLEEIKRVGLPAVVTFSPVAQNTCDGFSLAEACKRLEDNGADVVGLNCGRGPKTMIPILQQIRRAVSGHVAALPVPYRTHEQQPCFFDLRMEDGKNAFPVALDPFLLSRFEMADFAIAARDMGINYIGICCGAGPHHVRAMAEALGRTVPASEYAPEIKLHPIFGDQQVQRQNYVECLYGPMSEKPEKTN
jgi:betaine-homocysteine S-methyltransferase